MFELIRAHQLNLMLVLCGACAILAFLLFITRFLSRQRKIILILMEFIALFLLWFDRSAYVYSGQQGNVAYVMVRVSNFMVFFLTSAIVFVFCRYIGDLLSEKKVSPLPKRLTWVCVMAAAGMILSMLSAFTGLYYYFDDANIYHRGPGFLIAYIIPVIGPILLYSVVRQYKKEFSKLIYISLVLYVYVPIACGIIQIFTYGISLVNMSMVAVSICLYLFTYLDLNNTVERAHEIELQSMRGEKQRIQELFDRVMISLVSRIEEKDGLVKGNSVISAEYAKKIAKKYEKDDEYCNKAYYSALFESVDLAEAFDGIIEKSEDETKELPLISKVSAAYADMSTKGKDHDALPFYVIRERFIREAGEKYDPLFADLMVRIIDSELDHNEEVLSEIETEIECGSYRDSVTKGIEIGQKVKRIRFNCTDNVEKGGKYAAPSIILFDSFDRRVHSDDRTIKEYQYLEYGELWFDDHMVATAARKMEVINRTYTDDDMDAEYVHGENIHYEIEAARYEDHLRLKMISPKLSSEIIVALTDRTKSAYIGLTGEHCKIENIDIEETDVEMTAEDIERIVNEISYIDHLESDVKNVQIDTNRSASTEGIVLSDHLRFTFHSMSLPSASLIWHCPYVVIYTSKDGTIGGEGYQEYDLVKLNGEDNGTNELAQIRFRLKKKEEFPGWEAWKEANKEGMEYEVSLDRRGGKIVLKADNLGISIETVMMLEDTFSRVYVAITGDQVALTDIRVG